MNGLNKNVGPVLRRFTCCTFYALFSETPQYCNEFTTLGMGLTTFCEASGYQPASTRTIFGKSGQSKSLDIIKTPSKSFIFLITPMRLNMDLSQLSNSASIRIQLDGKQLSSGYYDKSLVDGDYMSLDDVESDISEVIQVDFLNEITETTLSTKYFSIYDKISGPPMPGSTSTSTGLPQAVRFEKRSLEILVSGEKLYLISAIRVSFLKV